MLGFSTNKFIFLTLMLSIILILVTWLVWGNIFIEDNISSRAKKVFNYQNHLKLSSDVNG